MTTRYAIHFLHGATDCWFGGRSLALGLITYTIDPAQVVTFARPEEAMEQAETLAANVPGLLPWSVREAPAGAGGSA